MHTTTQATEIKSIEIGVSRIDKLAVQLLIRLMQRSLVRDATLYSQSCNHVSREGEYTYWKNFLIPNCAGLS